MLCSSTTGTEEREHVNTVRTCKVILERRRVSYARYLETGSGTWTERTAVFDGTFVECWDYIQEHGPAEMEFSYTIKNEPPRQGPEEPPEGPKEDELPF